MAYPGNVLLIIFMMQLVMTGAYVNKNTATDSVTNKMLIHTQNNLTLQNNIWLVTETTDVAVEHVYFLNFDTDMIGKNHLSQREIRLIQQNFGDERFMDKRIVDIFLEGTLTQRIGDIHRLSDTTAVLKIERHTCAVLSNFICYGFYEFGLLNIETGVYQKVNRIDLHDQTHHRGDCIPADRRQATYRGRILSGVFLIETSPPSGCSAPGVEAEEDESVFWLITESLTYKLPRLSEVLIQQRVIRDRPVYWRACSESSDIRINKIIDRVSGAIPDENFCIFDVEPLN